MERETFWSSNLVLAAVMAMDLIDRSNEVVANVHDVRNEMQQKS